ncbi:glycosyltransferase [candidate division KSB1 bacterium]|nr:glycosyltransferase [candidate division KSB1 bacterium]NIV71080.1 glycosyltransferase [Phycisphaerae bacterium]NIR72359.1 glycosyltransferase [candidate division KSB1 bacterium]NIS28362.1 glycosyltransferase [candidate division KSB1 bacterium]NIT75243.1 glycosyltransferase [candidate division KSB1 bacterium]
MTIYKSVRDLRNVEEHDRKINILFFLDYLYGFGGTERHLFDLARRLNRNLFDTTICPFRFDSHIVQIFREAGIKVEPAPLNRIYGISALKQASKIYHLIRERNIDIVQTFNIDSDLYGTLLAKWCGVPVIVSSRRDLGVYRKRRHLVLSKFTHRYVSHFIAVCNAVARNLTEREQVAPERVTTIYNGFDLAELSSLDSEKVSRLVKRFNISPSTFVVGNVSHFRPEKGYGVFFDAIRKVRPYITDLRVLAVGGGPKWLNYYRTMVREAGLDDVVFFTGYVAEVLEYISLMDVCCLTPVSNEGFSNAILEQMALGKAVIATDVGGSGEAICHGESGLIIPANDAEALVKAIITLHKLPDLRQRLGANARARVEKEFNIGASIAQMERFYYDIFLKHTNGKVKVKNSGVHP